MSLVVVGVHDGREVGHWPLRHGQDPVDLLAEHGWVGKPVASSLEQDGRVVVVHAVVPRPAAKPVEIMAGAPGAKVLQRLAAYALVVDEGRLLMSQLAGWVSGAAGLWTLPGGGVDPGEAPLDGVVREVHEEAGQHVVVDELVQVQSRHWVGDVASGDKHEDFHAVRLIHRASCPHPRPAHVVEVDGSTAAAAWVPLAEVARLPLADMVRVAWQHVPGSESYPL